jgi:hypothetical protein
MVHMLLNSATLPLPPSMIDSDTPSTRAIATRFITGFAENALLNSGQLEPGMSVLTKPFAIDVLAARVHELIAK